MIGKILKQTQGKPCSCPVGKKCSDCARKRIVNPQVFIEEPRRLTIPIVISRHRQKPSTADVEKPKRWIMKKKEARKSSGLTICQWYKRRKALRELEKDEQRRRRREKQVEKEKLETARRQRDIEFVKKLETQEKYKRNNSPVVVNTVAKERKKRERFSTAKPEADTKYASVNRRGHYDSLSNRFVNCFYKICCQFYCYMCCILIIGFVIVYFI